MVYPIIKLALVCVFSYLLRLNAEKYFISSATLSIYIDSTFQTLRDIIQYQKSSNAGLFINLFFCSNITWYTGQFKKKRTQILVVNRLLLMNGCSALLKRYFSLFDITIDDKCFGILKLKFEFHLIKSNRILLLRPYHAILFLFLFISKYTILNELIT